VFDLFRRVNQKISRQNIYLFVSRLTLNRVYAFSTTHCWYCSPTLLVVWCVQWSSCPREINNVCCQCKIKSVCVRASQIDCMYCPNHKLKPSPHVWEPTSTYNPWCVGAISPSILVCQWGGIDQISTWAPCHFPARTIRVLNFLTSEYEVRSVALLLSALMDKLRLNTHSCVVLSTSTKKKSNRCDAVCLKNSV
jgi:hypothetical protein